METLNIVSVEDKQTQTGKSYQLCKDSNGNSYSNWNKKITCGTFEVNVKEANGYKTITSVIREVPTGAVLAAAQPASTAAPVTMAANSEPLYRINVKQTAAGKAYWDVSVRADTLAEAEQRLREAVSVAEAKCTELNVVVEVVA